jgi:hypothetical protein
MSWSHVSRATLFSTLAVPFAGAAVYHAVACFDPASRVYGSVLPAG